MPKRAVIMVAGGTGTRMASPVAKQFLLLSGKPVIMRTFEAFQRSGLDLQYVLVLYPALRAAWEKLISDYKFDLPHAVVDGGAERFHSVRNGLTALNDHVEYVAVHDAVRPLVSTGAISRGFAAAVAHGAAVPVVPVTDTIRRTGEGGSTTLPRNTLVAVQTPQCFRRDVLEGAYNVAYEPFFTDDASVVERSGHYVHLFEGNRSNIKVTTPEDLVISEALFSARQ